MLYQLYDPSASSPRSFGQLMPPSTHLPSFSRTRSEFPSRVNSALCQCPSVRLDWLPSQYLTFGRRLSFLVSTGGVGDHPYLPTLRIHSRKDLSLCIDQPRYHGRRPTFLQTCCLSHLPTWREYSLGLMGFPCGMQIPRRQPSVP